MIINFGSKVINSHYIVHIRKSSINYTSGRRFRMDISLINNYGIDFEFKTKKELEYSFNKLIDLIKTDDVLVKFPISDKDLEVLNDEIIKCPICNRNVKKSKDWFCSHCGKKVIN